MALSFSTVLSTELLADTLTIPVAVVLGMLGLLQVLCWVWDEGSVENEAETFLRAGDRRGLEESELKHS